MFYHRQQILSVVFLKGKGPLCSFSRKCLFKYLSLNTRFFQSFFWSKNCLLWKKIGWFSSQLNHTSAFPSDEHQTSVCNTIAFCVLAFSWQKIKKICVQGQDLLKLILTTSSRMCRGETGIPFPSRAWGEVYNGHWWCLRPDWRLFPAPLPIFFVPSVQTIIQWWRQMMS